MEDREVIGKVGAGDGEPIHTGQSVDYRKCTDPFCPSATHGEHGHAVVVDDE